MKRCLLLLFVCLLMVTTIDAKRYITTEDTKVREGKGSKYGILGTIKKGVIVNTDDTVGKWRKLIDQDEVGYVSEKFLAEPPADEAPVMHGELSLNDKVADFVNRHTIPILVGVVVLLIILRRTAQTIALKKQANSAAHYEEKHKSLIKYWYQCKHCAASIKKDSEPSSNGCSRSLHHSWTQLAEVGQHKYHCKNCGVTIHAKTDPTDHGCPQSALHRWEKKK